MMGQEPLVDATTRPGGSSPESDELPTVRPPSQQASRQTARQTSRQTTGILPATTSRQDRAGLGRGCGVRCSRSRRRLRSDAGARQSASASRQVVSANPTCHVGPHHQRSAGISERESPGHLGQHQFAGHLGEQKSSGHLVEHQSSGHLDEPTDPGARALLGRHAGNRPLGLPRAGRKGRHAHGLSFIGRILRTGAPHQAWQGRGVRVPAQRLPDQIHAVACRFGADCLLRRSEPRRGAFEVAPGRRPRRTPVDLLRRGAEGDSSVAVVRHLLFRPSVLGQCRSNVSGWADRRDQPSRGTVARSHRTALSCARRTQPPSGPSRLDPGVRGIT